MELPALFRFVTLMVIFFPLLAMFRMTINLPHFMYSVCCSLSTSQVPQDLLHWCVHTVLAELISWFLTAEMVMFAFVKLLYVGLVQPFLPLFWWLCLCYEAYLFYSPDDVPFLPRNSSSHLRFCRTRCIYSEFQLNGSFKFLDTLSRDPSSKAL